MNKELRNFIMLGISLLVIFIVLFLFSWNPNNKPIITGEIVSDKSIKENTKTEKVYDEFADIQELHWTHMPLTYSFENREVCGEYQANRIEKAFNKIQEETDGIVSFEKVNDNGEIKIICNKKIDLSKSITGFYIAGESLYQSYTDYPNKLSNAEIYFYNTGKYTYSGGCVVYPDTEIHEILHTFGFEHTSERNNIMNPHATYCPSKLNYGIIEKLKKIYSK